MTSVATPEKGKKKLMISDVVLDDSLNRPMSGNNHNLRGGNVGDPDGSCEWVHINRFYDRGNFRLPLGYYAQMYYGYEIHGHGHLPLQYPDGNTYGWNHQCDYGLKNAKMYGYR